MVSAIFSKIDSHKSCGLNGIAAIGLIKCVTEPTVVLSKLYNICLDVSCFQACWKFYSVVAVLRTRAKFLIIRTIHLFFGKVLET